MVRRIRAEVVLVLITLIAGHVYDVTDFLDEHPGECDCYVVLEALKMTALCLGGAEIIMYALDDVPLSRWG